MQKGIRGEIRKRIQVCPGYTRRTKVKAFATPGVASGRNLSPWLAGDLESEEEVDGHLSE